MRPSGDDQESKALRERAVERIDVRAELLRLEQMIEALRVDYEQFFLGFAPHPPDKLHGDVRRLIRKLIKAPFKNSQMTFALRMLENRFQTYNSYWSRVNREREEGTYSRDVFKANLREKLAAEEERSQTGVGKTNKHMQELFQAYKLALEKQTGKNHNLDYSKFQSSLIQRAKEFKSRHGDKQLSFKVVVKGGKVTLKASAK